MEKTFKQQKGITLVALIITIIVLLILAMVTIKAISGEKVFEHAENARSRYTTEQENENNTLKTYEEYIEDRTGKENWEQSTTIAEAKTSAKPFRKDTVIEDDYGNSVKIPAGFKIASDSGENVTQGIVIEDVNAQNEISSGNQFVWIPVGKIYTDAERTEANAKQITLGRYSWGTDNNTPTLVQPVEGKPVTSLVTITRGSYTFVEAQPTASGKDTKGNTIAININDFYNHTITAGGYYIGRYEAGDADATAERIKTTGASTEGTMICKKGQFVYNHIIQADAASECKNMYSSNNFTSDLINSYAWDTAILFIKTFGGNIGRTYGGSNLSTAFTKTGMNSDEVLKICDLSGNAYEWTTETCSGASVPCTTRGGYYYTNTNVADCYTCFRGYTGITAIYSNGFLSFRPILYW